MSNGVLRCNVGASVCTAGRHATGRAAQAVVPQRQGCVRARPSPASQGHAPDACTLLCCRQCVCSFEVVLSVLRSAASPPLTPAHVEWMCLLLSLHMALSSTCHSAHTWSSSSTTTMIARRIVSSQCGRWLRCAARRSCACACHVHDRIAYCCSTLHCGHANACCCQLPTRSLTPGHSTPLHATPTTPDRRGVQRGHGDPRHRAHLQRLRRPAGAPHSLVRL